MKKTSALSELTTEQLIERRRKMLAAFIGLGVVMIAAVSFMMYHAITAKQPAFIAIAVGCSVSFLPMLVNLGQLNSEIKSRKVGNTSKP